jgi:hypothetical protein
MPLGKPDGTSETVVVQRSYQVTQEPHAAGKRLCVRRVGVRARAAGGQQEGRWRMVPTHAPTTTWSPSDCSARLAHCSSLELPPMPSTSTAVVRWATSWSLPEPPEPPEPHGTATNTARKRPCLLHPAGSSRSPLPGLVVPVRPPVPQGSEKRSCTPRWECRSAQRGHMAEVNFRKMTTRTTFCSRA